MFNQDKIVIAIDGYSSCGKSTLARELAKELHYVFIDSGAMYRGVTLFAIQNNHIHNNDVDRGAIIRNLNKVELSFKLNSESKKPELFLNGVNVEAIIRTPKVAAYVSRVATIKEVREKLVREQRKMGSYGGIVMDGRDIGSVVFPEAELKFFVTAEINERVRRRFSELRDNGIETTKDEVKANLLERDRIDSTRMESPLIQVEDAIEIDNTKLSKTEQLEIALSLVEKKLATLA
ncbi:MAG: (d)CMP kinase [Crocinitomicaceae bacterium]|nr:(d)CMP kinase [Crocinitomicaceae bacterium]